MKKPIALPLLFCLLLWGTMEHLQAGWFTNTDDFADGCGTGSGGGDPSRGTAPGGTDPVTRASPSAGLRAGDTPVSCGAVCGGDTTGDDPSDPGGTCSACGAGDDDNGIGTGGLFGPDGGGGFPIGVGATGPGNGSPAGGMATWRVSEPYINLWLYDEPIGYQPGRGPRLSLGLAYKQRGSAIVSPNIFSLGTNWNCSWLSYVEDDPANQRARLMIRRGGLVYVSPPDGSTAEYYTHTTLERLTNSTTGDLTGYLRTYPSGASDYYLKVSTNVSLPNSHTPVFLTARVDPAGRTNVLFTYDEPSPGGVRVLQLTSVTDADGRVTTLSYTNAANYSLITGVADPFGRSAVLKYDAGGRLTNVTDVAGLSSSFQYDSQNWVTTLTTPYGTTTFEHLDNGFPGDGGPAVARAIRVVDPAGGTNIYMLRELSPDFMWAYTYSAPDLGVAFDNWWMQARNSFHWGPRQAAGLPLDMNSFADAECMKARIRHWLHATTICADLTPISQILTAEIAPSPDGVALGLATWYSYDGMDPYCPYHEGTNSLPSVVARTLPDGTIWYAAYQRDVWGRPTTVTDTCSTGYPQTPMTRTVQYQFDGPDLVTVIGPQGETRAGYAYTNHLILRATNAVGEVTSYTCDAQGRLTSVRTPAGLTHTNIYFASGPYTNFVQKTIDLEINRTNSFTYTNDLLYTHTDERGLTTTFLYDSLNRLTNRTDSLGTITYVYDKLDLVRVVDRMGFTTGFAYDPVRRRTAETNALGRATLYNYCACGALDSIRDAGGNYTYFTYDNAGRRLSAAYPDLYTNYFSYDALGELTNTTDSAGISITQWFNNQGQLYAAYDAAGQRSALAFDVEDRVTNSWDANAVSIAMTYDDLGRLLSRTYPDAGVESFGYSARGVAAYTNQLGFVTRYGYDEARRKTAETNANTEHTLFSYNAAGDLLTLTDGKNQVTTWHYDPHGRVTNKLDQGSAEILRYAYDPDNRLTNRWSAAKGNTGYAYDPVGNLTNIAYPASGTVSFAYDAMNRVTDMVDSIGATHYTYDAAGQVLTEDGPFTSDTVTNTYSNRRRVALSLEQPADYWFSVFDWDSAGRLSTVTSPAGTFGYGYTALDPSFSGRLVQQLSLPSGAYISDFYDPVARLLGTVLTSSGSTMLDAAVYGYNEGNQRTAYTNAAGAYVQYLYDPIGQLTNASSSISTENRGYAYDPAWNLQSRNRNGVGDTFTVDGKNQLTSAPGHTLIYDDNGNPTGTQFGGASATLAYDDENRLVSFSAGGNTSTFAYDGLGRLRMRTESGGATVIYIYDGLRVTQERDGSNWPQVAYTRGLDLSGTLEGAGGIGGLLARSHDFTNCNTTLTYWLTNDSHYGISDLAIWDDYGTYVDGVWVGIGSGDIPWHYSFPGVPGRTYYVWGLSQDYYYIQVFSDTFTGTLETRAVDFDTNGSVTATDSGLPLCDGGTSGRWLTHNYYHADGNGNITCLVNPNDTLMASYRYDPFGNTVSQSGALADANVYRFSSKEFHAPSGLYYYGYRFYDSSVQRWLNRDPIGEPGFEVLRSGQADLLGDGPNLYAFVKNNPMDRIDPLGLDGEATLVAEPTLLMDEEALAAYRAKQCRCAILAAAVQAAKKGVGALGGAKSGDSCAGLKAKTAAWLVLAVARSRLNNVCFGGGDATHQDETAKAWAQVGKAIALQTEKGCVGSPTGGGGKR